MKARIYKPARTAMQQGRARTHEWVLEHELARPKQNDPLMGWTGSSDTREQVRLFFDAKEAAIAYAERRGIDYILREPRERRLRPKSYAENFRWNRTG